MTIPKSEKIIEQCLKTHPAGFDLNLKRILHLLEKLDNPQKKLPPTIHIAGTNGKGSSCAFSRALLEAAGYKVHLHTSPHLVHWNERFRIASQIAGENSQFVDDENLSSVLKEIVSINQSAPITVFEILTTAAFLLFSRIPADAAIFEVGLGGRLDATNVIENPACSIITPIAYDHESFLGNNIRDIALEKAGIIKKNSPLVIGAQNFQEARDVLVNYAQKQNAPYLVYGEDFYAFREYDKMIYQDQQQYLDLSLPKLSGIHQIENAATALCALLKAGFSITQEHIEKAWQNVYWPARLQKITTGHFFEILGKKNCDLWIDGGHNPHAAQTLVKNIQEKNAKHKRPVTIIIGMLQNKNSKGFIEILKPLDPNLIFIPIENNPKSADPQILLESAKKLNLRAQSFENLEKAISSLKNLNLKNHQIYITGSLYLCGQFLKQNQTLPK